MIGNIKEKAAKFWNGLTAAQKRSFVIAGVIVLIICIGLAVHKSRHPGQPGDVAKTQKQEKKKEVQLDTKLLEKNLYSETKKEISNIDKKVEDIVKKEIGDFKKSIDAEKQKDKEKEKKELAGTGSKKQEGSQQFGKGEFAVPPPPPQLPQDRQQPTTARQPLPPGAPQQPIDSSFGDIEVVTIPHDKKKDEVDKKKEPEKIYLPPSFMEATLLTGMYAPTIEQGKKDPVPVLLRIKDLAVLPNKVKANLKGCFVIASATGSLADERAHLQLVSLSCITRKGKAVIDADIKGFVVDQDGKNGLAGTVVSKMDKALIRMFLAGFFGGAADYIKQQSTTTNLTAWGSTQTLQPGDLNKAAIGGGISTAFHEASKLYMELSRMAMPVIEVGAVKNVTLVVQKGVYLELKEQK